MPYTSAEHAMVATGGRHESPGLSGRLVRRLLFGLALLACILTGCRRADPPPAAAPPLPAQPPKPTTATYPTLSEEPQRAKALQAYLDAWAARDRSPEAHKQALDALFMVYRDAYAGLPKAADAAAYDKALRILWDLCGVVHSTALSPEIVKHGIDWQEPAVPEDLGDAQVSPADAVSAPLRTRLENLPHRCLALLRAVPVAAAEGPSYYDFVADQTRQVYLTPQLPEWSPSCPMDVCGSSEPLTRTLILASASYIDLSPKPDWSQAAVAVHEAAHIAWFHSEEVEADPRLLLATPNERNAFAQMAAFLRGMLSLRDPELKAYVDQHRKAMQDKLVEARKRVTAANELLGLPANDESRQTVLPETIQETELRALP